MWLLVIALLLPAQDGKRLFEAQCALCHGQNGGGGRGPTLLKPKLPKAADKPTLEKVISGGLPPEMPGAWQLNPKEVTAVATYVISLGSIPPEIVSGNPDRGLEVYSKSGCAGCHIVSGVGSGFGPELTNIGSRRNAAHLREAITNPAAALPRGFLQYRATPLQGPAVQGIRLGEDPFTLQLVDSTGRLHSFRRNALKSLTPLPKTSPMPAYPNLNAEDLDNLVGYLASLKGTPQ
jgi:putative heme-binding domain-containing protein